MTSVGTLPLYKGFRTLGSVIPAASKPRKGRRRWEEMADEKKIAVIQPETNEQAGECCEPECGPTTCEPAVEAVEARVWKSR